MSDAQKDQAARYFERLEQGAGVPTVFERLGPELEDVGLAAPPRSVPWRLRCHLLTGNQVVVGSFAFLLASFGMLPLLVDLGWWHASGLPKKGWQQTTGQLHQVRDTGFRAAEENIWPICRYDFVFHLADGTQMRGHSYGLEDFSGRRLPAKVAVEYQPQRPETSRLQRTAVSLAAPSYWTVVCLVFLVIGLVMTGAGLVRGLRVVRLLRSGVPGPAAYVSGMRQVDGSVIVRKDVQPSQPVLYDPVSPGTVVAVSRLGVVVVTPAGTWRETLGLGPALKTLLVPFAFLAAPLTGCLWGSIFHL